MDEMLLKEALPRHGLGEPLHVFASVGSTNDVCRKLAAAGAPHGTLVLADEQRQGRGRAGRRWFTPPGSALALSLLLRPAGTGREELAALNMLGALGVALALEGYGLTPAIKWPNDVLLGGRKVAGVLAETAWRGEEIEHVVLGIGVNVAPASVPGQELEFPATCVEAELGKALSREALLLAIIDGLAEGLDRLSGGTLLQQVEARLAFLGAPVQVETADGSYPAMPVGLATAGRLRLRLPSGEEQVIGVEARLRPVD